MRCPACQAENDTAHGVCARCGTGLRVIIKGSLIGDRYEIRRQLGTGGMGVVYEAFDQKLREAVALKVLRADQAANPALRRRFVDEIRLARRIRHRNVCGIHEYGEDGDLQFIAMELVDGVDLKSRVRDGGPLPPDQAYATAIAIALGLQAIHDEGILHRDLKSANVMLDARGGVRLMDFGIAKESDAVSGVTGTGMVVGTPEYMSPERLRGGPIDHRIDIYALGVISFELFTGEVPFRASSAAATLYLHMHEPPPLDGLRAVRIPVAARPVLARALAKSPADRYASAGEMADALRKAQLAVPEPLPTTAVHARPAPPAPAPPPLARPRPVQATAEAKRDRPPSPPIRRPPAVAERAAVSGPGRGAIVLLAAIGLLMLIGASGLWLARFGGGAPVPAPAAATTPEGTANGRLERPSASSQPAAPSRSPETTLTSGGGTLVLRVVPFADVTVDGRAVGMGRIPLAAGRHVVVLEHPDYEPLRRVVTVRAGAATELAIDLAEDAFRRR